MKSLGIIGYGSFGSLLHRLVQQHAAHLGIKVFSTERDPDGVLFFSEEDVAGCDGVVLAVPISQYRSVLTSLVTKMRPDTVIVDIATVKKHTVDLLRTVASDRRFICLHPMFGPESIRKRGGQLDGLRLVVSDHTLDASSYGAFASVIQGLGIRLIEMDADRHDLEVAETLFLTHYVGQVVARGGFTRTDIDTVSFGSLMDAVDSVRLDSELFAEVFCYNPYCREVIERFESSGSYVRLQILNLLDGE